MLYAVWAATAAGDPGYGQAAFIISGIAGHLYLRKLKLERPVRKDEDIEIPNAEFSVEILEEEDKYVIILQNLLEKVKKIDNHINSDNLTLKTGDIRRRIYEIEKDITPDISDKHYCLELFEIPYN